ncbi:hypothetical protein DDI_4286 [Dickeya dianthicola RNS04.9]|nr:hypothetical protein DDI_4286 [Dickeya dianthicola RNS04.9]
MCSLNQCGMSVAITGWVAPELLAGQAKKDDETNLSGSLRK